MSLDELRNTDLPHQPDGIDSDSRDLPELARAIERVRSYVSQFGDGLYDVTDGAPLYGRDLEAVCRAAMKQNADAQWLIWSRYHRAWWKADENGYTTDMMCAGRYGREHADRIASVRKCKDGTPGEVVVREPEISLIGAPNLMEKMRGRIAAATRAATRKDVIA